MLRNSNLFLARDGLLSKAFLACILPHEGVEISDDTLLQEKSSKCIDYEVANSLERFFSNLFCDLKTFVFN